MGDGDTRWIHRGAYDLVDLNPEASLSAGLMPRSKSLYGSLPVQMQDPDSFASQLQRILSARRAYDIAASRQILVPDVEHPGLLIMVHELPAGKGTQITALNFGATAITETLHLPNIAPGPVVDIINERVEGDLTPEGEFTIVLDAYEGLALRVVSSSPMI
jgi:trehalose synthase